jgi:DNA primase RepB-like protein
MSKLQHHAPAWRRAAVRFLKRQYSVFDCGFVFCAAKSSRNDGWIEKEFLLPVSSNALGTFLGHYPRISHDLYFCPHPFSEARRKAKFAQPTFYAQVDIDDADPSEFSPTPSMLTETSPGRFQGVWIFDEIIDPQKAEAISKWLAYTYGADKNGWSITKYLRIPFTLNHKPNYDLPLVRLVQGDFRPQNAPNIPSTTTSNREYSDVNLPELNVKKSSSKQVLRKFRGKMHPRTAALARAKRAYRAEGDRSKVIFEIVSGLHQCGATKDEIAAVLQVNPFFISKHGPSQKALVMEVVRITSKLEARS